MRSKARLGSHRHRRSLAATVVAFAMAAWGPCAEDKTETSAKSDGGIAAVLPVNITGKYSCTLTENNMPWLTVGNQSTVSVCKDDKGYAIRFLGGTVQSPYGPMRVPDGPKIRIRVQGNKFTFTLNPMPGERIVGNALSNVQNTVVLEQKYFNLGQYTGTATFTCSYQEPCQDNLIRAVFIRPCEGQLYKKSAFSSKNPAEQAAVADGTLNGICKDLRDSWVTDVFLPFKVDHEGKGCGNYGELLYDSEGYDTHENVGFQAARAAGFDPIKKLMDTCKEVYKKAGKKVKFHAWFPVFKDKYAANIQGVEAKKPWFGIIDVFSPTMRSTVFADPAHPTVSVYELAVLQEIVDDYKVDGINLDYIRYPDVGEEDIPVDYTVQVNASAVTDFVRKVRERFPEVTLSADVMASESRRIGVGQEKTLPVLDIIMLMDYSYFGVGGPEDVKMWIVSTKTKYPDKVLLAILRGWGGGITDLRSRGLVEDLKLDIQAVKDGRVDGYSVFTYESLLMEGSDKKLKNVKKTVGY